MTLLLDGMTCGMHSFLIAAMTVEGLLAMFLRPRRALSPRNHLASDLTAWYGEPAPARSILDVVTGCGPITNYGIEDTDLNALDRPVPRRSEGRVSCSRCGFRHAIESLDHRTDPFPLNDDTIGDWCVCTTAQTDIFCGITLHIVRSQESGCRCKREDGKSLLRTTRACYHLRHSMMRPGMS